VAFFPLFKNFFFRGRFSRLRPGALTQEVLHHLGPPSSQEESKFTDQMLPALSHRMVSGEPCLTWKYEIGSLCYVVLFARVSGTWRLAANHRA
jgi:hypothetical protein